MDYFFYSGRNLLIKLIMNKLVNCLFLIGSKSQQKASSTPVTKDEKALNPASRRVREAAENLLSVIMEQVFV